MNGNAAPGGRFFPLPVLAAVLFFVLAAGGQYNPGTAVQSPDGTYWSGFLPNVAQAWTQMQTRPAEDWASVIALDTLAGISPLPVSGLENVTVYFTSMSGYPFRMLYIALLADLYGDLHPGARVLAYFMYDTARDEWVLLYIMNTEMLRSGLY